MPITWRFPAEGAATGGRQYCGMGELVLVRHGATEWSVSGRHTGRTDLPLTADGERQAARLGAALRGRRFGLVVCSEMRRAVRTAELAGLVPFQTSADLDEWDYGRYEGLTTEEITSERPGWRIWSDGAPEGESPDEVAARVSRVLAYVEPRLADGGPDVALVGHGHALRVLAACWLGLPPADGRLLRLDTATWSVLGWEHGWQVVRRWNSPGE
jgi:probable phosphoglycerate mutase